MICFSLALNGRRLATAGIPGFAVLSAIVTSVQRKPRSKHERSELTLHLGGLDSNSETDDGTHLSWLNQDLSVGDRIEVEVLESPVSDPPASRRPSFTREQMKEERARSARAYLREYKRQRAAAEREIRHLEKVIAAEKKKPATKPKRSG